MASIKKLLSKKGWTGKEVGKTLIACLLHDLKHIDEEEAAPLLTQAEYKRMEASLETERDFTTYRVYVAIHEALREFYNKANSYLQQVYHGVYRILPILRNYILADKEQSRARHVPVLMTAEQCKQISDKIEGERKAAKKTKQELLFQLLRAYFATLDIEEYGKEEEGPYSCTIPALPIPDAIRKEIAAQAKKTATNKQAIAAWWEACKTGGFTLPDGRYIEDVEEEEAAAILAKYTPAKAIGQNEAQALYFMGADAIRAAYKESTGESLPDIPDEDLLTIYHNNIGSSSLDEECGASPELWETIAEKLAAAISGTSRYILAWKLYDIEEVKPPTKAELLKDCLEYYEGATPAASAAEGLRAFKKDYPALHAALEQELLHYLPAWKALKPAQASKATITCGELAALGFLDYAEAVKAKPRDIITACNPVSFSETIALVANEEQSDIDAKGRYKAKSLILHAYTAAEIAKTSAAEIRGAISQLITPAMRFINAYNAWLEVISTAYDVPDVQPAKISTQDADFLLKVINKQIYLLYNYAENKEERAAIKEAFTLLPVDSFSPPEDRLEEVEREIVGYGYTTTAAKALNLVNVNATIKRLAGE